MTEKQKEAIKRLKNAEFRPTWGFGGGDIFDLPSVDSDADEIQFRLHIYSPCFDCESMYCNDRQSCDKDTTHNITPDGLIDGECEVDSWLNSIY